MSDAPFVIAAYLVTALTLGLYVRSLRARLLATRRVSAAILDRTEPTVSSGHPRPLADPSDGPRTATP